MITSEDDGQCTGGEDFAHRLFRSVMISSYVLGFGNDVSTIDNFDVAPVKQGTANIEIITIKPTKGALAIPPDMRWGIRLIITCFAHGIRIAKGNP